MKQPLQFIIGTEYLTFRTRFPFKLLPLLPDRQHLSPSMSYSQAPSLSLLYMKHNYLSQQ